MKNPAEALLSLITQEIDAYQALLAASEEERTAIIHADLKKIEQITVRKRFIYEQMQSLEPVRNKIILMLSSHYNIDSDNFSLTNLSELVKESYSSQIKADCQTLAAVIKKVEEVNRGNTFLIERFLELVRGALDMANQLTSDGLQYSKDGKIKDENRHGQIVSEIG